MIVWEAHMVKSGYKKTRSAGENPITILKPVVYCIFDIDTNTTMYTFPNEMIQNSGQTDKHFFIKCIFKYYFIKS